MKGVTVFLMDKLWNPGLFEIADKSKALTVEGL